MMKNNPKGALEGLFGCLNDLGNTMIIVDSNETALNYYLESYKYALLLFERDSVAYRSKLSITQHNIGVLYGRLKDYDNQSKYCLEAMRNRLILFRENPKVYRDDYALTLKLLAENKLNQNQYEPAIQYFKDCATEYEILYKEVPAKYEKTLKYVYKFLAICYGKVGKVDEGIAIADKLLELDPKDAFSLKIKTVLMKDKSN